MIINTNTTKRAFPDLKIGISKLRKSKFTEVYDSDLEKLEKNKLCFIATKDDDYTIFYYSKNAFNTKFELFLNYFPVNNNITHSIDELNTSERNSFFDNIEYSQCAIKELATMKNEQLLRIYSYQHIGVNELNSYDFKTSYSQTHWHIYGVDKKTIDKCVVTNHNDKCFQNTFSDFFIELYAEILGKDSSCIDYNTHSIILKEKNMSLTFDNTDRSIITNTLIIWKKKWKLIASCFTNFEISNQGRFVLYNENKICENINRLIFEKAITFSSDSKKRLFWLAKKIKKQAQLNDSESKDYWRTIHMGINGSIGITHNFENKTSTIRIAPRTFATLERIGCLDGFYFCLKNRKVYLSNYEISEIGQIQEELFSIIKSKSK